MDISSKLPASSALPDAVFTDFSSLQSLRDGGNSDSASSLTEEDQLEEAARQFSSIFLHMALKSMRDASFGGGILDSQQSEFYRDMFDQQISLDLSQSEGFGLTQLIVNQLSPKESSAPNAVLRRDGAEAYLEVSEQHEQVAL